MLTGGWVVIKITCLIEFRCCMGDVAVIPKPKVLVP